jgi:hypothetical protein
MGFIRYSSGGFKPSIVIVRRHRGKRCLDVQLTEVVLVDAEVCANLFRASIYTLPRVHLL